MSRWHVSHYSKWPRMTLTFNRPRKVHLSFRKEGKGNEERGFFLSKTEIGNPMTRATHPNKTETGKTQSDTRACFETPISSERSSSSECLAGPLGLKLDYSNNSCCAMVSGINDSGVIPTWNLEHPSDAVTCLIEIQKTPANTSLLLFKILTVTYHHE